MADYPPETRLAVDNWLAGIGLKPKIDPRTKMVMGFWEGPGHDPASTFLRLSARRDAGDGGLYGGLIDDPTADIPGARVQIDDPTADIHGAPDRGAGQLPLAVEAPTADIPGAPARTRPEQTVLGQLPVHPMLTGPHAGTLPATMDHVRPGPGGTFPLLSQSGIPDLPAFGGAPQGPPRPLTDLGAPSFLSGQAFNDLLPSELEGRMSMVGLTGIPVGDYAAQQQQSLPTFGDRTATRLPTSQRRR